MFRYSLWSVDIKYSHSNRIHFLYTSIIGSIMSNSKRMIFAVIYNLLVIIWLKHFVDNAECFSFRTCIRRGYLTIRKMFLKTWPRWSATDIDKLCCTIKFETIHNFRVQNLLLFGRVFSSKWWGESTLFLQRRMCL